MMRFALLSFSLRSTSHFHSPLSARHREREREQVSHHLLSNSRTFLGDTLVLGNFIWLASKMKMKTKSFEEENVESSRRREI